MFKITKKISSSAPASSSKRVSPKKTPLVLENTNYFKGLSFYLLPNGIGKNRVELFKNSLVKNGAELLDENKDIDFNSNNDNFATDTKDQEFDVNIKWLIIVDENTIKSWDNLEKALARKRIFMSIKNEHSEIFQNLNSNKSFFDSSKFRFVTSLWLTECLKQKKLINTKLFELKPEIANEETSKPDNAKKSFISENVQIETNQKISQNTTDDSEKLIFKRNADKIKFLRKSSDSESEDDQAKKIKLAENDKEMSSCLSKKSAISELIHNRNSSENDSSYSDSEIDEDLFKHNTLDTKNKKWIPDSKTWTCAHSSKEQPINHNKFLTDKLEALSAIYENTRDKYRALGYQKGISALKRHPHQIQTKEVYI
jgi:hypothetical protein